MRVKWRNCRVLACNARIKVNLAWRLHGVHQSVQCHNWICRILLQHREDFWKASARTVWILAAPQGSLYLMNILHQTSPGVQKPTWIIPAELAAAMYQQLKTAQDSLKERTVEKHELESKVRHIPTIAWAWASTNGQLAEQTCMDKTWSFFI